MYFKSFSLAAIVLSIFIFPHTGAAQENGICPEPPHRVYLVRHAEKDRKERDKEVDKKVPLKSPCGFQMAKELSGELKNSGITAIYTTEYTRTKQTAKPLADSIPLIPSEIEKKNLPAFEETLCTENANKTILVVGHSDTSEKLLKILGLEPERIDYCELFIINYINGSPVLNRITYCNYHKLCGR